MTNKELSNKIDQILVYQHKCSKDVAVIKQDLHGVKEMFAEYKKKVNTIESRQWKISSITAGLSALIAYFFKK